MTTSQRILNIVLLPLVILIAGLVVKAMIASKPAPLTRPPPVVVPSVSFVRSTAQNLSPTLSTYGNTQPYYRSELAAQVAGQVLQIAANFNAGQSVARGDLLVEIDPADYKAQLALQQATLANSQQVLAQERANAELAALDWVESGRSLQDASALSLRQPQLTAAQASVAAAQAGLDTAHLELARTQVRAPFDAIVQKRNTSPGNIVNFGSPLGALIAKEKAEVRLPLTPQQVKRLQLPVPGQRAQLTATLTRPTQPDKKWLARITRTEPGVDPKNQVIYVVGEIERPFQDPQAFLPIGAFVNARIVGSSIPQAHRIPQTALVEDRYVWLIDSENQLLKVAATRIIADRDALIVRFDSNRNDTALQIAVRPLASFYTGQLVIPIAAKQ
jgi:RND family efflux transporter MFP subunit